MQNSCSIGVVLQTPSTEPTSGDPDQNENQSKDRPKHLKLSFGLQHLGLQVPVGQEYGFEADDLRGTRTQPSVERGPWGRRNDVQSPGRGYTRSSADGRIERKFSRGRKSEGLAELPYTKFQIAHWK